jgi:LmbE family N-acetylglucosaminyl deacetylase
MINEPLNNLENSGKMDPENLFQKSLIVAAHPDDEVLWFSSILDKVDVVITCFLSSKLHPDWGVKRERSLKEHPRKNICCLGLTESGTFLGVDWDNPIISEFGLEITNRSISDKNYKINYYNLKQQLGKLLKGYQNIFTHNPWGEYGHPEHVQIFQAIKGLKNEMKFNLWFSNYCSNNTSKLMAYFLYRFNLEYVTFKTNKALLNDVKDIYKRFDCWTWYDNSEWFDEESFVKDGVLEEKDIKKGQIIPLNFIKVAPRNQPKKKTDNFHLIISKILRILQREATFLFSS